MFLVAATVQTAKQAARKADRPAPIEKMHKKPAVSAADELAKYAQLYKDGLIAEQEFADIKAKIFARQSQIIL